MPVYAYLLVGAGTLLWFLPFALKFRGAGGLSAIDRRARWGIGLQCISYSLLWQGHFWEKPPAEWRVALAVLFFALAWTLSWGAAWALGKQWRLDAAIGEEHDLVRSGPYRLVRHPIYTSMLCVLLGTGFAVTALPLLGVALVVFPIGTQIRVRVEDGLLASRFGPQFQEYRRITPAYIPFLK